MKYLYLVLFIFTSSSAIAQDSIVSQSPYNRPKKGDVYLYFGWNLSAYSDSDIRFKGEDYDFTLENVEAFDRQSDFDVNKYFNPTTITIPQYNIRIGYYLNEKYNISIGADHMKYVVQQGQEVTINGQINNSGTLYDGTYTNDRIIVDEAFLTYEHTDGLNYINAAMRRQDVLVNYKFMQLNATYGLGSGVLIPKTNARVLGNVRYDQFHVSGFGVDAMAGLNLEFFKHFFIQTELKGGYINLPNVRTTQSPTDSASQDFFFRQVNLVFGARFHF